MGYIVLRATEKKMSEKAWLDIIRKTKIESVVIYMKKNMAEPLAHPQFEPGHPREEGNDFHLG